PRDDIVRQRDLLDRRAKDELARVEHERFTCGRLDRVHEALLFYRRIDIRVPRVAEHLESRPEVKVDTRRLHVSGITRLYRDTPRSHLLPDRPIGENHHAP